MFKPKPPAEGDETISEPAPHQNLTALLRYLEDQKRGKNTHDTLHRGPNGRIYDRVQANKADNDQNITTIRNVDDLQMARDSVHESLRPWARIEKNQNHDPDRAVEGLARRFGKIILATFEGTLEQTAKLSTDINRQTIDQAREKLGMSTLTLEQIKAEILEAICLYMPELKDKVTAFISLGERAGTPGENAWFRLDREAEGDRIG